MTTTETQRGSTTQVLSQDLQPGDELIATALGGTWGRHLSRVSIYPECVEVTCGAQPTAVRLRLPHNEICQVRRRACALVPNPAA